MSTRLHGRHNKSPYPTCPLCKRLVRSLSRHERRHHKDKASSKES